MLQPFAERGIKAAFNVKGARYSAYFHLQLIEKAAYSADETL
jgi:hypothetical protein